MKSRRSRSPGSCPSGYTRRRGYVRTNTGTFVRPVCIRSQSGHRNTFKATMKQKLASMKSRIASATGTKKRCPPGKILRAAYVRRISSSIAKEGYTKQLASGKVVRVFPKSDSVYVPAGCIDDKGKQGKLPENAPRIGPLRKGELRKYGYSYKLPEAERRSALQSAIDEFGPLSTYRKLNAVAKLTVRSQPAAAKTFAADRNWVKNSYAKEGVLQAF